MLVFFRRNLLYPWMPNQIPYAHVGIATESGNVYFEGRRRLRRTTLQRLSKQPHEMRELPAGFATHNLEAYFTQNHPSPELVQGLLRARIEKDIDYLNEPIKLPIHDAIDGNEHARRCEVLLASAKATDMLCTFDPSSSMSRLIGYIDQGPWSHTASVMTGGRICEAVTSGVRIVEIEHYLRKPIRLGLYRFLPPVPDPESGERFLHSTVGNRYAFGKATLAGIKRFIRIRNRPRLPNDLALMPGLSIVCRV
jgi:hypothetical protein